MVGALHTRRTVLHLSTLLALVACGQSEQPPAATPSSSPAPPPSAPAQPELVAVVSRPLGATETLQGELLPYRAVDLFARVAGYVKEVRVDRGSRVRQGDVLIEMEAPELLQQRSEAEARLAVSRQTAERLRAAAATPGAVAPSELEAIDASVKAEEARTAALRQLESYLLVRAPFSGVIAMRGVHPGALVGPNSGAAGPMLRLEDHERLRLVVSVPERLVAGALVGRQPTFRVAAWPGDTFTARVTRVSGSVDPRTRGMLVELDVPAAAKLSPGMFADVAWPAARAGASLLIPTTSIVQTATRTYVAKLSGDSAILVDVKRGLADGDVTEVFGALSSRDSVVKRGSDELVTGTKLRR